MPSAFSNRVINIIKNIPKGRVATYGQVAALAGRPRAAREVAWVLHSFSEQYKLPWHRVINSQGRISLPQGDGYEEQKRRLQKEGVEVGRNGEVNLHVYLWHPPA